MAAAVCASLAGVLAGSALAQTEPAAAPPPPDPAGKQVSATIPARRETLRRSLRFQRLGRAQGLPNSQIQSIVQDKTGFIWIGTGEGLARYDGQRFLTLRHNPAEPGSLSASFISDLLLARDGTLWVGTIGGGVNRYLPDRGAFDRFTARPGQPDALQSSSVLAMAEGPDGRIWVGTRGAGLGILDPATG
ncbi:MAG TPA: two-component regulator propeller domain-containing protein, partial [Kofleriaceae bacterium]|nr:two-component regulator propeller domain-containing protein [Kofleriaceae bacterium]